MCFGMNCHTFPAPSLFLAPGDFPSILMISAMCLKDVCYILSSIPRSFVLGSFLEYLVYHIAKITGPCITAVIKEKNWLFFFLKKEHENMK